MYQELLFIVLLGKKVFIGLTFLLTSIPLVKAEQINNLSEDESASSAIELSSIKNELYIKKTLITYSSSKCDVFYDPRSINCQGTFQENQPANRIDSLIQGTANYLSKFIPLLNSNSEGNAYTKTILNDGKKFVSDKGYGLVNEAANSQIQKIPFFAQTSIAINAAGDSDTSFSIDGLMKIKEMNTDKKGDLKTLFFGQARASATTSNDDGLTTNLGLGLRHRPNDMSMVGGNVFWDYKMTDYSSAHSRLGLGGEYLWNNLELRNNYYIAITEKKNVTVDGISYTERIVPGWDAEIGYRLPNYPQLGVFLKAFNWDYQETDDQNGVATTINWQATRNINLEFSLSNEISGNGTKANSKLTNTDDYQVGFQVKWTAQPVNFKKNYTKKNLVTQMTQPVRRRYDVLLERSSGGFSNRVGGS